jgi:outer membrane receptor for ferrienterochelin and colicin
MKKFKLLAAAAIFAAPVPAYAQQITTQIEGTVSDEAGAPVANATVTITDTRTGAARTIQTGEGGSFSAVGLTAGGPYTVTAEAPGFQGQTVEGIVTSLAGATTLGFNLASAESAGAVDTIVVTGARANIQLRAIGPGTAFGTETLATAPSFNRDVRDIIRIDPRVSLDRDDGGSGTDRISCLGGNDRGNAFTVDGISQGDIYGLNDTGFSSRSSTPIPYDAVRETQVQFAPFDVEYGQFTGCSINVVTRSGTNRFTGGGFYEISTSDMRGETVDGVVLRPVEDDIRYGVFLGGPIIPDRLFFFGAYEHQEAGQSQDIGPQGGGFPQEQVGISVAQFNQVREILQRVYGIDTGDIVTTRPFSNDRYFGRLDWQINDDHRLEATYQRLEEGSTRPDDQFTGNSPQAIGQNTFYTSGTISNYYSARLYSNWSDRLSTELRYSRSEVVDQQNPIGGGEAQDAVPIPRIIVGIDNPTGIDGTVLAGPGTSRSANDLQTTLQQIRAQLTYAAGDHRFKFGVELNRADIFNLFVQNATGTLVFRNVADLEQGLLSPGVRPGSGACASPTTTTTPVNVVNGCTFGAFGNFTANGDVTSAAANFQRDQISIYLQDEWSVTDQLSLVLGIRTDLFDGNGPALNNNFLTRYGFPNTTGFRDLDPVFQPRLGFTYDFDDFGPLGRSQLRGGVGVFSGGDPLVFFGNAFQNNGFGFAEGTTGSANCPRGQIDVVVNGQFTGVPQCFRADGQTNAGRGLGDTQSISPDIEVPTVIRANIGLQTEFDVAESGFFAGWRLNLDYIYSRYENPFTIVDLSQTPDFRRGLNGFTIDGRPIYAAIDPNVAGCTARLVDLNPAPVFQNVNAVCFNTSRDDELQLTNTDGYESHIASIILARDWDRGIFTPGGSVSLSFGYAYTDSQDRRNLYNSTAGSNYDLTAAFDRQNPVASRGFYESRHNISARARFSEELFGEDLDTTLSFTLIGRSGRPYSLTFTGGGIFNDSVSGNDNALLYVPNGVNDPNIAPTSNAAAVQQLVDFTQNLACARGFAGQTIARNTCTNDWYWDLDLSFSQDIPGPLRMFGVAEDSLRLYATFDNFLNFLNDEWNIQRRRNFAGLQDVATTSGVDAQGRYIITGFTGGNFNDASENAINVSSSVWRLKVGVSYRF